MSRTSRQRQSRGRSLVGEQVEVEVGPVAHGGHFVARHDGRVIFVRHALPGERVTVRVTEGDQESRFLRGDAVRVLEASPDRVEAPCPYSGPDACGGCDFQHVALAAQRALKGQVLAEQLRRLAGLEVEVEVEAVPGDQDGLRWRSRVQYARGRHGRIGLRKHRSHAVVAVDDCRIARPDARVVVEGAPVRSEALRTEPFEPSAPALPFDPAEESRAGTGPQPHHEHVVTPAGDRDFAVDPDGFWQVHPGAPSVLVETVLGMLAPEPGESAMDLYCGVGLFSAYLAEAVGPDGHVLGVEGDASAADHARDNLSAYPWTEVVTGPVRRALEADPEQSAPRVDLVVLDPPREGAKRAVVDLIADRTPRSVVYVACDPAALARDLALFAERGYHLDALRAFDLFPMTHHLEAVARLRPR